MPEAIAAPLSDAGRARKRQRRDWAVPGSDHDRVVAIARVALPATVGILLVLLAIAPITSGRDISFVLAKDRVAVAKERLRVSQATYRGEDSKGQPFAIKAQSAVQQTSADPVVRLQQLSAHMSLTGGLATLVAPRGRYNMTNERVALDGPVEFRSADGYQLSTTNVLLDMETRRLAGNNAITGRMPLGTFSADRMRADLDQRAVALDGHAHLHIVQRNGTSRR